MQKTFKRVLAVGLSSVMAVSAFSISAAAYNKDYQSETHRVFRHTEQTLAPGVEYYNNYAYYNDGEQVVYYAAVADINRDDVLVQGGYMDAQVERLGMSKLTEQAAAANAKFSNPDDPDFISEDYKVVAGTNGDFYNMQTGQPSGAFAINGKVMNNANNRPWFAIFADGTALCGANNTEYNAAIAAHGAVQNSVGGSQMLVVNGADVTANASGSYNTDRHSRTMIGVTADNKVVSVVVDGRQSPFSDGGCMHELAQIMIEAECVTAINLDGGGSTTFGARPEGEDSFRVINRPSDGSERSISSGVLIVSLAKPSTAFDHVTMSVADEYVTPGTSTELTVAGVSASGSSADLPADITYEATSGSVADGVYTAGDTAGDVTITAKHNGASVGTVTLHVVVPDSITFASDNFTIPYGKSAELGIIAKYGLNEVKTKAADFTLTIEDPAAGTVDGLVFTAAAESAIASTGVTAVFNGTELTATAGLIFGKGSEVIFDFEDGTTQGFNLSYSGYNYYLPNSKVFVADKNNGQVHSGNYALGMNIDYSNSQESGYQMIAMYQGKTSGNVNYYEGALTLGTWLYIPDEYVGLWVRWTISPISAINENAETGEKTYTLTSLSSNAMDGGAGGTGVVYSFDESGWHYLTADLSTYKGLAWRDFYYCMQFYISDRDGASYGYYAKNQHNINGDFTVYMDDVTVDYSTVVEDREAPVFSQVILGDEGPHSNEGMTLTNGYVSDGYSRLDLSARVAENTAKSNYSGLDESTVQVLIDGNPVAAGYANGIITAPTYDFAEGQHVVKFIICDKAGNRASATRTFTVANTAKAEAVKVVAHDPSLDRILHGSLYYVDVVAANAERIDTITTTLNLDSMSKWEIDHMTVADGFTASYEVVDAGDKVVKLTIQNNGSNLAGEQALVSIPIRTWFLDNSNKLAPLSDKEWTYAQFKASREFWPVGTEVRVQQGEVNFTDGSKDSFTGENVFVWSESWANYANMTATTEGKAYHDAWDGGHIHTDNPTTINQKDASCTEKGYTGDKYCDVCNSIIEWGEEIPETGHTYGLIPAKKSYFIISDNGINKSPDIEFNGGIGYWYDNGEYKAFDTDSSTNTITFTNTGNFANPTVYCWFEGSDGAVAWPGTPMTYIGENDYGQAQFTFEMPEGEKVLGCTTCGELCNEVVDGKRYVDGKLAQGVVDGILYADGEKFNGYKKVDGVYMNYVEGVQDGTYTGLVTEDGVNYYSKFGELTSGWFEVDGDWYYFVPDTLEGANGTITNEARVPLTFENGKVLKGEWEYTIGKYRYWYGPTYYKLNSRNVAYLEQEVEGATYLFDEGGYRATGIVCNHESNARDLIWYDCGTDGKATRLTGPQILENNGKLYYVNEEGISPAGYGLVKVDGAYYYVLYNGTVKTNGERTVTAEYAHGLVSPGVYNFGADGKMTNAPIEYGIDENGYYRENGEIVPGKGLVLIDGDYYYVIYNGKIKKDGDRTVTEELSNGLLPAGTYHFGPDGKMTTKLSGIDDDGFYRENGVIVRDKGLVEIDGDYYYVIYNGKIKIDGDRTVTEEKANGLVPAGTYHFGPDGKMVLYPANGIGDDGFYREDGEIVRDKGLVLIDGDYYYVIYNGKIKKDGDRTVTEEKANGLVPAGTYHFGSDGKMVNPPAAN